MPSTLLLDQTLWDLVLDVSRNIARADPPYAIAQDVASAIRLFQGELWYDTTKGIPYFEEILGHAPPLALMKAQFTRSALTVPTVVTAVAYVSSFQNRTVEGQVQTTTDNGTVTVTSLTGTPLG